MILYKQLTDQWLYPLTGLKSRIVTLSHMKRNSKYMVIYTDIHTRSHQLPQEPVQSQESLVRINICTYIKME